MTLTQYEEWATYLQTITELPRQMRRAADGWKQKPGWGPDPSEPEEIREEVIRLCDRAYVMYHGQIRGELAGERLNEQNIMLLATGGAI